MAYFPSIWNPRVLTTHLWLSNPVVGPIIKSYRASDLSQVVVGWGWGSVGFQVRVRTAVVVGMEASRINLLTIVQQLKGRSTFIEWMDLFICTSCSNYICHWEFTMHLPAGVWWTIVSSRVVFIWSGSNPHNTKKMFLHRGSNASPG